MLRTFGLESRFEAASVRGWAERLVAPLAMLGVAALLARVQPLAGIAPFALAFLAAGLARGAHPAALLAGCLTGCFPVGTGSLSGVVGAGVALAGMGTARLGGQWLQRRRGRDAPVDGEVSEAALCVAAGLSVLVPGAAMAAGDAWQSARVLGTAAVAAASAPFFRAALGVRTARRHLMPEERAGALILLCALLAGIAELWTPAAVCVAFLGTLVAAPLGAGAGACTGLAAGAVLVLTGSPPVRMAALGLCGLIAGLAARQRLYLPGDRLPKLGRGLSTGPSERRAGFDGGGSAEGCVPSANRVKGTDRRVDKFSQMKRAFSAQSHDAEDRRAGFGDVTDAEHISPEQTRRADKFPRMKRAFSARPHDAEDRRAGFGGGSDAGRASIEQTRSAEGRNMDGFSRTRQAKPNSPQDAEQRAGFGGACCAVAGSPVGASSSHAGAARASWMGAAAMAACAAVATLVMRLPAEDAMCALAACAGGLVLPAGGQERLRGWLSAEEHGATDPDRLARRIRAETEHKLRALSAAFGELAEGYREPVDVPDEQTLICDMRARLCEGCSRYPVCWTGNDNRAVRFLCQLISEAIDWSGGDRAEPLFAEEMPPDVLRQCARGRAIPSRLGVLLEEFADKRRSELKRGAVSQLISAQFLQAQLLLGGMADVQARPLRVRGRQAARARAALDRAGVEVADVMALRGARRMEIVVTLKRGVWSPERAARASVQLSRVFGRAYAPDGDPGAAEMKFVRLPRLRASAAAASHSREAGTPSGDSHIIRMLDGDRLLMMLSDGMGSGEEAAKESAQTLRLLSQFLAADVARPLALETVNELMLARTDADMFATVDLCVVDLTTGIAEFSKLAACRSLILKKEEVTVVEGGRLPLGILERVQPSTTRVKLQPGDVILMASDGVMDAIDLDELCACLEAKGHQPPEMLAESILSNVERRVSPQQRDDMTVLCAHLSERRIQ